MQRPFLKKVFVLICFYCTYSCVVAQNNKLTINAGDVPITKEAALKFRTIQQAFDLPPVYKVDQCKVMVITKEMVAIIPIPGDSLTEENVTYKISHASPGDKLIFTDVILNKNGRQIKLADKIYVFL